MNAAEPPALEELRGFAVHLPPDVRALVAEGWAKAARAEHASIASFARFTLELLAVGAPPELVRDAQRAALDEISHAELAFAIASVYAGRPLGPGPLPLDANVLGRLDLDGIVASTVTEGCVGETLAAAEAEAAFEAAVPKAVKNALRRVATDEATHAALAFRFVSWAVTIGGPSAREAARSAFSREIARRRAEPALEATRESALREHGLLPAEERRALRRATLDEAIEPALRDLALDLG
jgi:hypothetical protein